MRAFVVVYLSCCAFVFSCYFVILVAARTLLGVCSFEVLCAMCLCVFSLLYAHLFIAFACLSCSAHLFCFWCCLFEMRCARFFCVC